MASATPGASAAGLTSAMRGLLPASAAGARRCRRAVGLSRSLLGDLLHSADQVDGVHERLELGRGGNGAVAVAPCTRRICPAQDAKRLEVLPAQRAARALLERDGAGGQAAAGSVERGRHPGELTGALLGPAPARDPDGRRANEGACNALEVGAVVLPGLFRRVCDREAGEVRVNGCAREQLLEIGSTAPVPAARPGDEQAQPRGEALRVLRAARPDPEHRGTHGRCGVGPVVGRQAARRVAPEARHHGRR